MQSSTVHPSIRPSIPNRLTVRHINPKLSLTQNTTQRTSILSDLHSTLQPLGTNPALLLPSQSFHTQHKTNSQSQATNHIGGVAQPPPSRPSFSFFLFFRLFHFFHPIGSTDNYKSITSMVPVLWVVKLDLTCLACIISYPGAVPYRAVQK